MRALRLFGHVSFRFDQPSPLPLELAAVELGLPPEAAAPAPAAVAARAAQPPAAPPAPRPAPGPAQPAYRRPPPPPAAAPAAPVDPSAPIDQRLVALWPSILRSLSGTPKRKFDVAALLRSSGRREIRGTDLVVSFPHQSNSERLMSELEDPRCRMEVERVLKETLGQQLAIVVHTGEQRPSGERSGDAGGHLIRAAVGYGGQVVADAPQPVSAPPPAPYAGDEPPAPAPAPAPYADASSPAPTPVPDAHVEDTSPAPTPALDAHVEDTSPAPAPAPYAEEPSSASAPVPDATPNGAAYAREPEPEPAAVPAAPDSNESPEG